MKASNKKLTNNHKNKDVLSLFASIKQTSKLSIEEILDRAKTIKAEKTGNQKLTYKAN